MIETAVHPKVEFVHTPIANYAIQQTEYRLYENLVLKIARMKIFRESKLNQNVKN
jgi:hypothetical protein